MFSSVGTWKLRVAYIIWLINEDLLWAAGCQFSQHRVEMKIVKKKSGKRRVEKPKQKKMKILFFTGLVSIGFVFTSKTSRLKNELKFYDEFL